MENARKSMNELSGKNLQKLEERSSYITKMKT